MQSTRKGVGRGLSSGLRVSHPPLLLSRLPPFRKKKNAEGWGTITLFHTTEGRASRRLQLGVRVGIDFAVQADFFELGCGPFHDFLLAYIAVHGSCGQVGDALPISAGACRRLPPACQRRCCCPSTRQGSPAPPRCCRCNRPSSCRRSRLCLGSRRPL